MGHHALERKVAHGTKSKICDPRHQSHCSPGGSRAHCVVNGIRILDSHLSGHGVILHLTSSVSSFIGATRTPYWECPSGGIAVIAKLVLIEDKCCVPDPRGNTRVTISPHFLLPSREFKVMRCPASMLRLFFGIWSLVFEVYRLKDARALQQLCLLDISRSALGGLSAVASSWAEYPAAGR